MAERAVFYQLTHKFVNNEANIPESARQVIYYSLAIGHHVGVLDCFQSMLEIPIEAYQQWLSRLPEGEARHKLEGLVKWGEIEINSSHVGQLVPALQAGLSHMDAPERGWAGQLIHSMQQMTEEPALYLMGRKLA